VPVFSPDGLVFRQRICCVVRPRPLSGVMVTAWWRLIGICTCLVEWQITLYRRISTGRVNLVLLILVFPSRRLKFTTINPTEKDEKERKKTLGLHYP